MASMQPGEDIAPDAFANDGNGNATSDNPPSSTSTENQATTVEDVSNEGTVLNTTDEASPNEEKDPGEPKLLTLNSLRDTMAQITQEADLSFLTRPSIGIGAEIKASLRYYFITSATAVAYVDHLEKLIASQKEGSQESVDLDREVVDGDPPNEPVRWKLGVKHWKEIFDRYGDRKLIDDEEAVEDLMADDDKYDKSQGHVLINSRIYDERKVHASTKLEIASPLLLGVLQKVIVGPPLDKSAFSEPYMPIFYYRKELQDAMSNLSGDSKDHLGVLLDFVKDQCPAANQTIDKIENGTIMEIGFNELWLLYPRGTIVYTLEDDEWLAYRVSQLKGFERLSTGSFSSLIIECESLKLDRTGFELEGTTTSFTIVPFTNSQAVRTLRLIPETYMGNGAETREHLVARGKRYWDYRGKGHFQEYTGNAWLTTTPNDGLRVMIDYGTSSRAYRLDIRDEINGPEDQVDRLNVLDLDPAEKLLYCPAKVLAFSLRDKTWKFVKISELQDVTFREDSFKKLVIKAKHKTVVKAMVRSYLSKEPTFGDLIQGKGRGLVVLLHGAPGTGKTLTAECVAEKENRPLYMVTCGDLGTEPDVLERKLQETFEFAVNWNAVLLLDEADVFLQERDVHDLKRNALVSVFLRQLEYFDGVLFLTTNRPGSLDEAFQSRIHITLGLPELHAESQMKVWAIFVKELEIGEEEKKAILKHVSEDIKKNGNLNGRQIRNAVRTAIAIAAQKKEQVSEQHVKDVLSIGRDFKVYLEQVNRMNQEQRAAAIGTRVPVKD